MENELMRMKEQMNFNSGRYFRCKECHQDFRISQESKKNTCRDCSSNVQIATCQTCHFPIYRGELIFKSSKGSHQGTVDTIGGSQDLGGGSTASGSHSEYKGTNQSEQ